MQKKINTVYMANLLICLLIVCSLPITSCKDDNEEGYEIVYPSEESIPFTVTELKGRLYYDEELKNWVISPEMESPHFHNGDEESSKLILSNMQEEYKNYEGEISINGVVTYLYKKVSHKVSTVTYYYSIDITEIMYSTTSRSAKSNVTELHCITSAPMPPSWYFTRTSTELSYKNRYQFRVYIHIVRDSSGIGLDKNTISTSIIEDLNAYYAETNIYFSLYASDYIDSSQYLNMTKDNNNLINGLFNENHNPNTLNIYILSKAPNFEAAGLAINSSNSCVIHPSYYHTSTLPHEIGHCLGLYHTHHGTVYEGGDDEEQAPELVNGSNSAIAGDYITDTPADPNIWSVYDCSYIGTETDSNGDYYDPDPSNVMSYAFKSCRVNLTQKQIERIHQTIENTPELKAACIATTKQITGPDYIKEEATYSVDVPDGSIVLWNITCKTYTDKTSAPSITTETLTGSSITLVNKNLQSTSQRYEMDVTITTPKGYVMHATKTVYHVLFSGKTGYLRWGYTGTPNNGDTISILYPSKNKTIEVTQGGSLAFYYADESGASSRSESSYYYFEMSNTTAFNRVPATNHAFYCKTDALPITISNVLLMIRINGFSNVIQIPIKIKEKTTYTMEEDSIETDITTNLNNKQLIKY